MVVLVKQEEVRDEIVKVGPTTAPCAILVSKRPKFFGFEYLRFQHVQVTLTGKAGGGEDETFRAKAWRSIIRLGNRKRVAMVLPEDELKENAAMGKCVISFDKDLWDADRGLQP